MKVSEARTKVNEYKKQLREWYDTRLRILTKEAVNQSKVSLFRKSEDLSILNPADSKLIVVAYTDVREDIMNEELGFPKRRKRNEKKDKSPITRVEGKENSDRNGNSLEGIPKPVSKKLNNPKRNKGKNKGQV